MRDGLEQSHPDDVVTAAYLDGTLADSDRDRFEAHLASCPSCRAGVAVLATAGASVEKAPVAWIERARGGAPPVSTRAHQPLRIAAGLLAAGVVLAVGAGLALRVLAPAAPPAPTERGAIESGLRALEPHGGAILITSRPEFTWSSQEGADRYVVTISDSGGRIAGSFDARAAGSPVSWPDDRPPLSPGTYLWSVRAMALDRVVAETRPVSFELR